MTVPAVTYRDVPEDRVEAFMERGFRRRQFFPHRIYTLPKAGPDGLKMAKRMCRVSDPNALWEITLHAQGPVLDEFPENLFFDPDVIWHQQHHGLPGHVATANLVIRNRDVYCMNYLSDLVQRISRRREFKTRVENRFAGWPHMLLNAVGNFAVERGLRRIYSPTADWTIAQIPSSRAVKRELFDRIYDRAVQRQFEVTRHGHWWRIDVAENRERLVVPQKRQEPIPGRKWICVCHDIERGWGHRGLDPALSVRAEEAAAARLDRMLAVEEDLGIRATYNVLGCFFDEVRDDVEGRGHCIAFHSFDHRISRFWPLSRLRDKLLDSLPATIAPRTERVSDQLAQVRAVDYRVRGYRPPQSRLTGELSDRRLCFHNFDWVASSAHSLGRRSSGIENRIVKIPILFDDFAMYQPGDAYDDWEREALQTVHENDFIAFGLHDCYGDAWLPRYESFLRKLAELGAFTTLDEVANRTWLAAAA